MLTLRDYQEESIRKLREGFAAGKKAQMLYLATGGGKSEVAAYMLDKARERGNRSAMILDRVVLVNQMSERLDKYEIRHGVLQSGHWRFRPYEHIQVCSAQTVEKRGHIEGLTLLVIDEAHCTRAQTLEFIKQNPQIRVIGLSATPFTKGLGKTYDAIVSTCTTKQLVDQGVLVPLKVFISKEVDMAGAKKVAGEWSGAEAGERGIKIVGDVVAEWAAMTHRVFGRPAKTIVFSSGVAHGTELSRKFQEQGYNFVCVSYRDDSEFKRDLIADFQKPDTEIHGLIATDILTKGFDCVAEGQVVLTDHGLVAIDKLLLKHKVWDGHEYVSHSGAIYKGERDVITYAGLTATPDHLVKTTKGWLTLGECAAKQMAIIKTGDGGNAICEHENRFARSKTSSWEAEMVGYETHAVSLRRMLRRVLVKLQHCKTDILQGMQEMFGSKKNSKLVGIALQAYAKKMSEGGASSLQKLWSKRNKVYVRYPATSGHMDFQHSWRPRKLSGITVGSYKQRRPLRAVEYSLGNEAAQPMQYEARGVDCENAQVQAGASRDSIRGQNTEESVFSWNEFTANNPEILQKVRQAKRRVWDVLNAGPRNCFTCEGLLIHNCPDVLIGVSARPFSRSLSSHIQQMGRVMRGFPGKEFGLWLDFSGNYLRFREDWEGIYENGVNSLDDGAERPKKEPTPIEKEDSKCPGCKILWVRGWKSCGHCGFVREKPSMVESIPGEMEELAVGTRDDKQIFWSMCRYKVMIDGWSPGRAAHTYREKYNVWPRKLDDEKILCPDEAFEKFCQKLLNAFLRKVKRK